MSAPITNEDKAVKRVECADCGAPMKLRETDKYKYGNGKPRKFYGCSRFPDCKGTHGAHPDGKPLGIPADVETKVARNNLHKVMEAIWGNPQKGKRPMYQWLKENAPKEHIGAMVDEISLRRYFDISRSRIACPSNSFFFASKAIALAMMSGSETDPGTRAGPM